MTEFFRISVTNSFTIFVPNPDTSNPPEYLFDRMTRVPFRKLLGESTLLVNFLFLDSGFLPVSKLALRKKKKKRA